MGLRLETLEDFTVVLENFMGRGKRFRHLKFELARVEYMTSQDFHWWLCWSDGATYEAIPLYAEPLNAVAPMYEAYIDEEGKPRYRGKFTLRQIQEFLI